MRMKYLSDVTTLKYDPEKCVGCRRCVEVCPHGVFSIENKKALVEDKNLCFECGACAKNCEFGALEVRYGVGCAAAIIGSMIKGGEPTCECCAEDESSSCS